jgi:hypothetical protein
VSGVTTTGKLAAVVGGVAVYAGESVPSTVKVSVWDCWVWSVLVVVILMVSVRAAPVKEAQLN